MRTALVHPLTRRSPFQTPLLNESTAQSEKQHHPVTRRKVSFNGISPGLLLGPVLAGDSADARARRSVLALRRGPVRFRRNTTIAAEGDPADCMFLVAKGVVRSCKTFVEGGRSIVAFHLPGELFGWSGPTHLLSAEAATDVVVMFVKRSALLSAAARDNAVADFLMANTANELRRTQEHSLLIGREAKCRLAAFLTDLSRRTGDSTCLKVPMSCQDIADHLGLTIETVSRTITRLVQCGWISRAGRRTMILKNSASLAATLS